MSQQIHALNAKSNRDVKVIVDQKLNPNTLETEYFNKRIENFKSEILEKISTINSNTKVVETIITRAPASSHPTTPNYDRSAINEMGSIDVKKYTIQNLRSFSKYYRFLSEQSKRSRELDNRLSDIVKKYTDSHKILGKDRNEYDQVLAFRDNVRNNHRDAVEAAKENWKRLDKEKRIASYRKY